MSTIQLYGGRMGSSLRCHWAFAEAGVEYENLHVNMREGEHKKEPFLKLNPNGQVPVLLDGDFVLSESIAINDYIAEKYKPELVGTTPEEKALVLQWSLWSGFNLQRYFNQLIGFRWTGVKDERVIEEGRKGLERFMPVLDQALNGVQFLVGNRFTLADINVCAVLTYNDQGDFDMASYPHVQQWMQAMYARPAFVLAKGEEKK